MENVQAFFQWFANSGIVIVVLGWFIWGLRKQIKIQNDTIKVMDKRIEEIEKVKEFYKTLFDGLPESLENYKLAIDRIYNSIVEEKEMNIKKLKDSAKLKHEEIERLKDSVNLGEMRIQELETIKKEYNKTRATFNATTLLNSIGSIQYDSSLQKAAQEFMQKEQKEEKERIRKEALRRLILMEEQKKNKVET